MVIPGLWQATNGPNKSISSLTIHDNNIFAASSLGYGIYLSSNNGSSWTQVNNGLPSFPLVNSLTSSGNNILAGTNHGVYLSSNNGNTWTAKNSGLIDTNVAVIVTNGNNIFAGTNKGIYLSSDSCNSWTAVNNGLPININVYAIAINGNNIFAGTNKGVYLSSNNGNNWIAINNGLPANMTVFAIAISGNNIFAGADYVYLSSNNGSSWIAANTGMQNFGVLSLAISGNNIFAGVGAYGGVYLSSDNGNSWTLTGLTYPAGLFVDLHINALAINGDTIFAGIDDSNPGVWKLSLAGLGITEISDKESFVTVYPNPVKDNLTVESMQKSTIEILNVQGQTILRQTTEQGKTDIDISRLTKGIYILRLNSSDKTAVTKIVKE
jgi:photosystem II stability/assembly factor-like uncharacterized protein